MVLALLLGAASLAPAPPTWGPLPKLAALQVALKGEPAGERPHRDPRIALARARRLWVQGRFGEASRALEGVGDEPLLGPFADLVRGQSLFYAGRPDEAARVFAELVRSPESVVAERAGLALGEAELGAGQAARAVAALRAATARGGASCVVWEELGRAAESAGDRSGAARAWREAWLRDPTDPAAIEARLEMDRRETGAAGATGPGGLLRQARLLLRKGRPEAAHSDLALAAAEAGAGSPAAARSVLYMAQADRALGRDDEAVAHWRAAAASRDPAVAAEAKIALARRVEADGDWRQATGLLLQAAELRRGRREGRDAAFLRAWMLWQHGEIREALAGFRALAARPRAPHGDEALWWEGWALYLQAVDRGAGRPASREAFDAAARAWEGLARLSRSHLAPQGLYWLARAYERAGHAERAAGARGRLRALAPGSYYVLLAGGPSDVATVACPTSMSAALEASIRRAAWLWALGYRRYADLELGHAARVARGPSESSAVAQIDAVLGEPGRAFALAASGRACAGPDALFPRPFRDAVVGAARAAGLDPLLIWSIMRQESRFRPSARSAQQAGGVMQLLGGTQTRIAAITGVRPLAPDVASDLAAAAWYLRALSERFAGNAALVAAAYNAGPEPVASWLATIGRRPMDEWVERIPYKETRGYVKAVLANDAHYQALFGPGAREARTLDPDVRIDVEVREGVAF